MSYNNIPVLTIGPNNGAKAYRSLRATARALSGTGSDGIRNAITRRIDRGGGFIGDVWVQHTHFPVKNSR